MHRLPRFFLSVACVVSGAPIAYAQSPETVVTRPVEGEAQTLKKGRVVPPANGETGKDESNPGGLAIYERMGAELPPLPEEKNFKGKVDEAYGAFQRGYYMTAMDKALPRAQLGDPAAQTLLGEILSQGLGVKKDTKAAAFWYGQAAQNGDAAAMFRYALILMEGRDAPRDRKKADELMKKAADAGNPSAQFNHAQVLVADNPGEKGLKLALPYYEKAAAQGIADAQYAVSQLYMTLPDVSEDKRKQAREWLIRAARAGFDTAQLDMGIWLVNGIGGDRDYNDGFNWLQVAAKRGNVVAQNKLAHLYINAIGTKPDPIEAAKWYVLSRRAGLSDPKLEDFYLGMSEEQQKKAIEAANKFRRS
ncbi:MAG: enhanced entry protein [Rhizobiales bacterium 63-7]|uniref:tetratricopeptide repeat protein n=1 Tax=Rhizobium sp. YJ-22 TaxID=3037556 RepID=UPI00092CDE94|nr:tetratricopeptide repeat protein [Rhizobium sp. YJ-22]MBN9033101.1 sel1 repeat family protein [Hyphomicrobiales bacterium]MDG3578740.1 tetratricopeptide repeat protein [Rhizobium sp. YJ-22]OJU71533.1 MAG: enhanced entry protein [Rhizobiales bacterium 63-7]